MQHEMIDEKYILYLDSFRLEYLRTSTVPTPVLYFIQAESDGAAGV